MPLKIIWINQMVVNYKKWKTILVFNHHLIVLTQTQWGSSCLVSLCEYFIIDSKVIKAHKWLKHFSCWTHASRMNCSSDNTVLVSVYHLELGPLKAAGVTRSTVRCDSVLVEQLLLEFARPFPNGPSAAKRGELKAPSSSQSRLR